MQRRREKMMAKNQTLTARSTSPRMPTKPMTRTNLRKVRKKRTRSIKRVMQGDLMRKRMAISGKMTRVERAAAVEAIRRTWMFKTMSKPSKPTLMQC